jgi:hypothetical protein
MMSHQHNIALAQKLLEGIGRGRDPTDIAALFDAEPPVSSSLEYDAPSHAC